MEIFHLEKTHSDKHIKEFWPKFALNIDGKSSWTKENVGNWTKQGIWCLLKKMIKLNMSQKHVLESKVSWAALTRGLSESREFSEHWWCHICSFGFFSTKETWAYWRKSIKGPLNWWSGCSTSAGISGSLAWRRDSSKISHQWIRYPNGG